MYGKDGAKKGGYKGYGAEVAAASGGKDIRDAGTFEDADGSYKSWDKRLPRGNADGPVADGGGSAAAAHHAQDGQFRGKHVSVLQSPSQGDDGAVKEKKGKFWPKAYDDPGLYSRFVFWETVDPGTG